MFKNYVYENSSAQYENKVLLIDDDNLENITHYCDEFSAHGFEVLPLSNDLQFRIQYEDKIKGTDSKVAIIVHPDTYVPYDIRRRLRSYVVSFSKLFPKLNATVLENTKTLDLDLLCLAYKNNFSDLQKQNSTEEFIKDKVYGKDNVKRYVSLLYAEILKELESAKTYSDWFSIAEKKAKVDVLSVEYWIPTDTNSVNRKFKAYVMECFGKLSSSIDRKSPILVSKTMEYMHDNSDKFIIIVMDGMSEFDWYIISESFHDLNYSQSAIFAMIPTTTSISRQCLLSDKYPSQLMNPWSQSKEKAEFIACAKSLGYSDEQIEYTRGYDVEFGSFVKCGAIIINDVDDMVHGQKQGCIGMFNDITVLAKQSKLVNTTKRLLKKGFDVYITADHGNTLCRGMGKLMGTGVETETKGRRMIVLKDFANKAELVEKYGLIDYPKYYLTKDYDYLLCDIGDSFDAKGEDVMSHGGITIDEVVVPFITIKAVQENG